MKTRWLLVPLFLLVLSGCGDGGIFGDKEIEKNDIGYMWLHEPTGVKIRVLPGGGYPGLGRLVAAGSVYPREAEGGYVLKELEFLGDGRWEADHYTYTTDGRWLRSHVVALHMPNRNELRIGSQIYSRVQ